MTSASMRLGLSIAFAIFIARMAVCEVILTPNEESGLAPVALHCVLFNQFISKTIKRVDSTVVPFPELRCDENKENDEFSGKVYFKMLDSARDESCGEVPNNNLDHNNMKRFEIYRDAGVIYAMVFKPQQVAGLFWFQRFATNNISWKIPSIQCHLIDHTISEEELKPYLVPAPGVYISVNGTLGENAWIKTMQSQAYKALMWYLIPLMYFGSGVLSIVFFSLKMADLCAHGVTSVKHIMEHKGGRSSVVLTLLFLEMVTSIFLSYVYHFGGYYSRDMKGNPMAFAAIGMVSTNLGTTLLAGVFGLIEGKRSRSEPTFLNPDERPFFTRYKHQILAASGFLLILDGVCGVFIAMRIPNFEKIVSGALLILAEAVAIAFVIEAFKFRYLARAIRKNLSSTRESSNVTYSLERMVRIFRYFLVSAIMTLCFGCVAVAQVILGPKFYVPDNFFIFWVVFHAFRWSASFCQIMMCSPDFIFRAGKRVFSFNSSKVTDISSSTAEKATVITTEVEDENNGNFPKYIN